MATQAPGICIIEPSEQTAVGVFAGSRRRSRLRLVGALAANGRSSRASVTSAAIGHPLLAQAGAILTVADVDTGAGRPVAARSAPRSSPRPRSSAIPATCSRRALVGRWSTPNAEWLRCAGHRGRGQRRALATARRRTV